MLLRTEPGGLHRLHKCSTIELTDRGLLKSSKKGWRDGSAVKSTDCSSKGPEFKSQQPHGGSQPSVMRSDASEVSEDRCVYIYIVNKFFLKKKVKSFMPGVLAQASNPSSGGKKTKGTLGLTGWPAQPDS